MHLQKAGLVELASYGRRPDRVVAWATTNDNLSDLMLIADGPVLLPAWLIWSCRIGLIEHESRNAV